MSLMTRVRIAIVNWWIRASQKPRVAPFYEDLEGIGRRLARSPLRRADPEPSALSPAVPVITMKRLVVR